MSKQDLSQKAKEINDKVFGVDRKNKISLEDALKQQVNENMRYSLSLALNESWVSDSQKKALVEVLNEQKDAVNILFAQKDQKNKAVQILKPLFGAKAGKFLDSFQNHFNKLQKELVKDLEKNNFFILFLLWSVF